MQRVTASHFTAGGLGAINHAMWLRQYLADIAPSASLKVILDSSWFISFNGDIQREFSDDNSFSLSQKADMRAAVGGGGDGGGGDNLFDIIAGHKACNIPHIDETPCCVSANCLLSNANLYPQDVPLFAIISLYDVFLLGASLQGQVTLAQEEEPLKPGYALDFIRTVAEYGGAMNRSIAEVEGKAEFFSYYVTGCFQHIYLATSQLWGEEGRSLFGEGLVTFGNDVGIIR